MKEKANTKKKNLYEIFKREWETSENADTVQKKDEISNDELKEEYRHLGKQYKKLVKEIMKITRIGDVNYKKLMDANELVRSQKRELEILNRDLREANALKDKFYSIIAHDLRNPLQFLLLATGLLHSDFDTMDTATSKKYIDKTFKTVRNVSELLENLLQWSRSQYGKIECRPRPINIYELGKEIMESFADNADKKGVTLQMEIPESSIANADDNMVNSIIRNLVGNALKFTPQGGTITLSLREEGNYLITSVIDTGIGIPADRIGKLFDIVNFSTSGTLGEKGSGLGLMLCKEFVEKNGGEISVESEEGKGSRFEFSLPKP